MSVVPRGVVVVPPLLPLLWLPPLSLLPLKPKTATTGMREPTTRRQVLPVARKVAVAAVVVAAMAEMARPRLERSVARLTLPAAPFWPLRLNARWLSGPR